MQTNKYINLDQITEDLRRDQKPARFLHILGVTQTSMTLADIYGADMDKAIAVALLHDCAKHLDREELLALHGAGHFSLTEEDMEYPAIWHGPAGAYLAKTKYGVTDEEILDAVEHHSSGHENPSVYLKIILCADYCEPNRTQPGVEILRESIRSDLQKGLVDVLNHKIAHLIEKKKKPHSRIFDTLKSVEENI